MSAILGNDTALVTGASRGIGRAIALALAAAGARVIGTATSEAGAAGITEALAPQGGRGEILNVSDPASIAGLFERLDAAGDLPLILVNNAAITRDTLALRMKDDDWNAVIDTNLSSNFRVTKAFLKRMMKERRGRIINITSVVGLMGNAGQVNYAAAKAGVIGLTKSLARELASRNITVNAVAPGRVDTEARAGSFAQPGYLDTTLARIPMGRLGSVEEVASAVAYLARPEASYITGQVLVLDGGVTAQ